MSWLARSIARTLELDDAKEPNPSESIRGADGEIDKHHDALDSAPSPGSPGKGVKEDLSDLTKTLTRQFWGVASFLAPPPPQPLSPKATDSETQEPSDSVGLSGIRSDFAEIGGRFRTGISKLSNNLAVTEFTKMASNFLQLGEEDEDSDASRGVVGVTDEVVAFARDIAMHPDTWLDFPLPDDEDDEDFDLSDAQQEHALAVEHLAPKLASLRFELCPGYMSEIRFWKIYFVLVHPRLDKHAAELLTTAQILEARTLLSQGFQKHTQSTEDSISQNISHKAIDDTAHEDHLSVSSIARSESPSLEISALDSTTADDIEKEKHPVRTTEIPIVDKSVVQEGTWSQTNHQKIHSASSDVLEVKDGDDADDWLKEESSEVIGGCRGTSIPIENEEDISFSDLEEDDGDVPTSDKKVIYSSDSSTKDSREWVQLGRSSVDSTKDINSVTIEHNESERVRSHNSEAKESNDWLDLDDVDVA